MTLGERIKKVRKELNLTQQKFGDRLGMKQNTIATYEMNRTNPSDPAIKSICREFNVSEPWLRTGEGYMFLSVSKEDELSVAVHKLLSGETSEFKTRLIKVLSGLGPREWEILEEYVLKLIQDNPTPAMTIEEEARAEADRYYEQLVAEKRRESKTYSANESAGG